MCQRVSLPNRRVSPKTKKSIMQGRTWFRVRDRRKSLWKSRIKNNPFMVWMICLLMMKRNCIRRMVRMRIWMVLPNSQRYHRKLNWINKKTMNSRSSSSLIWTKKYRWKARKLSQKRYNFRLWAPKKKISKWPTTGTTSFKINYPQSKTQKNKASRKNTPSYNSPKTQANSSQRDLRNSSLMSDQYKSQNQRRKTKSSIWKNWFRKRNKTRIKNLCSCSMRKKTIEHS
jgi:hypothetical protein